MKVLLDTNILIYAIDQNSKYYKISINILKNMRYELFVSTKNIAELLSVTSKMGIDKNIILEYIDETVLDISKVLYPNEFSFKEFIQIISEYNIKGNKVYDMEIVSIMLANKIDTIATFNRKDFENIKNI